MDHVLLPSIARAQEVEVDFWQVVNDRHSVRSFEPGVDVPPESVERLLSAAIRAPSAGNRQPWHFYVVRDHVTKRSLVKAAYSQGFVGQAPVVVVVCADVGQSAARYGQRGRELYCLQDTAAATAHILLAAVALGLGGCWVGAFDERLATRALGLPKQHRPVAILPIGKPAGTPAVASSRQPVKMVASYVG